MVNIGRSKKISLFVTLYKIPVWHYDIVSKKYVDLVGLTRTKASHGYKLRPKMFYTNALNFSSLIDK